MAQITFEQELIEKYESSVFDYLAIMQSSDIVKSMADWKYAAQTGLAAITHIFKLAYYATKNASTSAGHCQKGIYCYIEYLEQTQKLAASSFQQMDYIDALTFIYDKSLAELYVGKTAGQGVSNEGSSSVSNILSVSESHQSQGEDFEKCKKVLSYMSRVCSILIWFQHPSFTLIDQIEIIGSHLSDLLVLTVELCEGKDNQGFTKSEGNSYENDIWLFVEAIQTTIGGITKQEYVEILTALQKNMKRQMRKGCGATSIINACLYLKTIQPGMTLVELGAQEKWKRPIEDLVKLAFQ
jgi:hypothetical protein